MRLPPLLCWALIGPLCASACTGADPRPGTPARHLLLVTVAGLRAGHTSAWQYQRPTTWTEIDGGLRRDGRALALDDLAAEGVMFSKAFTPSGATEASLATLFTGRPPLETGVLAPGDASPESPSGAGLEAGLETGHATLAGRLTAEGFATAGFVSGESAAGDVARSGFEVFEVGRDDRDALGRALDWVNLHDFGNGKEVFLWVHLAGPTFPFEPTLESGTVERGGPVDFAKLFIDESYAGSADGSASFRAAAGALSPADRDRVTDLYDGEVAQANHLLQLFLDFYRYAGAPSEVWQRTLFVLAGTAGLELFEEDTPGRWGRTERLTDSVLHVPLLVRHPDSLTGRRIFSDVVELQDVMPTFLDWFRLGAADTARGRSLLPVTDHEGRDFEERASFGCRGAQGRVEALTVRGNRFRLIWTPGDEEPYRLFDQTTDPLALDDLASAQPETVERLKAELEAWLQERAATSSVDLSAFGH